MDEQTVNVNITEQEGSEPPVKEMVIDFEGNENGYRDLATAFLTMAGVCPDSIEASLALAIACTVFYRGGSMDPSREDFLMLMGEVWDDVQKIEAEEENSNAEAVRVD